MSQRNWLAGVLLAGSLSGCGLADPASHLVGPDRQPFKADQKLGFEVVQTILARNRCLDCHSAARGNRGNLNLEGYENVKAKAASVAQTAASGFMPIGGPKVSAEDVAVLQAWADAGAPETSDLPLTGAPTPIENPDRLNFAKVKAEIFTPHCVRCHSGFAEYKNVDARLDDIQMSIDLDNMPKNAPPLSRELKALLVSWIEAGAPEL